MKNDIAAVCTSVLLLALLGGFFALFALGFYYVLWYIPKDWFSLKLPEWYCALVIFGGGGASLVLGALRAFKVMSKVEIIRKEE